MRRKAVKVCDSSINLCERHILKIGMVFTKLLPGVLFTDFSHFGKGHAAAGQRHKSGIQKLQQYEIIIDSSCINLITEFENYAWDKDKNDEGINKPIDAYNHGIDALRYSLQCLENKSKIKTLDKSAFGF